MCTSTIYFAELRDDFAQFEKLFHGCRLNKIIPHFYKDLLPLFLGLTQQRYLLIGVTLC